VLDWEFSYSGCAYADAANMLRFASDYPPAFVDGFRRAYGAAVGPDVDWVRLGRVMDLFALSDLLTRPPGHPVAGRAAIEVARWAEQGLPG
jgi:hypothetical protein